MQKLKKQKGITLIALIITIIVMLILVGVTINVALNGGLFEKAKIAKEETIRALEKEELTSIAIAAYDASDRQVKKTNLNYNGKYTEQIDKTTTEKIVVKGESGILWQINIMSAKVEEYVESSVPEFYGVSYCIDMGNGEVAKYYFLENGIVLMNSEQASGTGYGATKYTRNEDNIIMSGTTFILSEDFETLSNEDMSMERNENYIYKYNPVQNQTYKIYSNALYASETTDNVILTFEETIQYNNYFSDAYPFSDMETDGAVVSDDGKQITYDGNVYTLVE